MRLTIIIYIIVLLAFIFIKDHKKKVDTISINSSNCLKGFMALTIVLCHLFARTELSCKIYFIDFGATAVGCFFFISGYGLLTSYKQKGAQYLNGFAKKRFIKLIVPFIFVIFLYQMSRGFGPINFIDDLHSGNVKILPFSWYVFCAILFYFCFYFVFRFTNNEIRGILLIWLFTLFLIVLFNIIQYPSLWWISLSLFPIGITYKNMENKIIGKSRIVPIFLITIITLAMLLFNIFNIKHVGLLLTTIMPFVFILPLTIFDINFPWLKRLGNISYEIYLVQGIILLGLHGNIIYISNDWLYMILSLILIYLLAIAVKYCLGHINHILFNIKK